ncbi:MAG: adenylosuccinate synthase [Candidatus Cloacimonadota bacterium]|nr:adenylosuccinate synthase [Candidatus Cloacimonadota bacterium]
MSLKVVLGALWGDEGKAKIIDYLAEDADVIVRFQGGCNAGHTVINQGRKTVLHIIPVGILHKDVQCIIGNGVVIDPLQMLEEISDLEEQGISLAGRLFISSQAHITLPIHIFLDEWNEEKSGKKSIGTTKRGIGPTYSDKYSRLGIRFGDLQYPKLLSDRIDNLIHHKKELLHKWLSQNDIEEMRQRLLAAADKLKQYISDTPFLINELLDEGKKVMLEGAQGTLLDIDFGSYPYVTSSNPSVGGAIVGTGINPHRVDTIVGIMKAYFTRVGKGPFPTELKDETGELIRKQGAEFGATTGRPRRCGWFDVPAAKFSVLINGFDEIALTKTDVFSGMGKIKICTHYEYLGKKIAKFPLDQFVFEKLVPQYISLPGWEQDISDITDFDRLPENTRLFILKLEELISTKISIVSVGPDRKQTIFRN